MDKNLKVKFPEELTDIVKKEDIKFLGHGTVAEYADKSGFGLYREANLLQSIQMFDVDQEYLNRRNLKAGDTVVYVSYPLSNGRTIFDVFSLNK